VHQKISCLYWLGAGNASCPTIEFNNYDKVVLVDARIEACNRLESLVSAHRNLCVVNACIGRDGEETSKFSIYNERNLSAKSKPTSLLELFPGLKLEELESVKALCAKEILNEVHPKDKNVLILELLDSCGSTLLELKETGLLHSFDQVFIRCGVDSLFEGAWEKSQVVEFLTDEFFSVVSIDDTDPDIQLIEFKFDQIGKAFKETEQENQVLKNEVEYLKSEIAQKDGLLIERDATHTEAQEKHAKELEQLQSEVAQKDGLLDERDTTYTEAQEKHAKELEQLKSEIAQKDGLLKEHNAAFTEAQEKHAKELEQLKSEIAQKDGLLKEHNVTHTEVQEKHAKELEQLNSEIAQKDGLLNEHNAAFTEAQEKHAKELEQLQSEVAQKDGLLNEHNAAFTEAQEKHAKELDQLKSEIAQKDGLLKEHNAAFTEAQEKHAKELEQIKSEIVKVRAEHERSSSSFNLKLEKLDDEKAKLLRQKQEFIKQVAQLTASISTLCKQNLKLQVDLDDLRGKFEEKAASEKALNSLIGELHQKLQQAAIFYRKLEKEHPELLGSKSE
jgi:chromosome segregation ATPase